MNEEVVKRFIKDMSEALDELKKAINTDEKSFMSNRTLRFSVRYAIIQLVEAAADLSITILERKFGEDYLDWSKKVPAFIPCYRKFIKGEIPFSSKTVFRREYSGVLATVFGFAFIDHLRFYFINGYFEIYRLSTYVLIAAMVLALILRTLKHHTRLLNEEDRS